jgi:hypothetical protein
MPANQIKAVAKEMVVKEMVAKEMEVNAARTRMGWMSEYGGLPSAISISAMPTDQMSATVS